MSEKKTHVVVGDCGEYSDWRMWLVRAFDNADDAEKEAARLTAWVAERTYQEGRWHIRWKVRQKPTVPGDEDGEYTGWEPPRYCSARSPGGCRREHVLNPSDEPE